MKLGAITKAALAGALLLGATTPAFAGSTPTNLAVSANVQASCTISTTAMAFNQLSTLSSAPDDSTATMNIACTPGTAWTATAGLGAGVGATFASRKMTIAAGTATINYTLYTNSTRTTLWGDGVAPNGSYAGTGTGATQASTIYGRVPGSQGTAAIGSYTDTVQVTVTF